MHGSVITYDIFNSSEKGGSKPDRSSAYRAIVEAIDEDVVVMEQVEQPEVLLVLFNKIARKLKVKPSEIAEFAPRPAKE
jgi:hypothetical protein